VTRPSARMKSSDSNSRGGIERDDDNVSEDDEDETEEKNESKEQESGNNEMRDETVKFRPHTH
jgi:hypothetical protein